MCNDPAIITTFLWADYHTHGPNKSTHLYSYSVVGLVDKGNAICAYSVTIFLWADYHTPRFSHLHFSHQVSDAILNSAEQ